VDSVESTETRVAGAPPEEAALVLAGLRALRRQHDPAQAGVLLARYLSQFPQGALVQEALAISIEAGLARGDRKAAAHLAEQYLGRFPTGRFVRLARKAAASTEP
jgi:outer membrane protein assembly factor BamD (BamD/ComL family)